MYKRTWGYFLLTMLVITGLAGRHHSETFSGKERRLLIKELKSTRTQILQSVETLNVNQLKYRDNQGASISKYMQDMATTEDILWCKTQEAMKQNNQHESSPRFDEELLSDKIFISNVCASLLKGRAHNAPHFTVSETITRFKKQEADLLRYLRTCTDDAHHKFADTPAGRLNIYELLMLDVACIQNYQAQIEKIKSSSKFPE